MNTFKEGAEPEFESLKLHLRRLRQWYGQQPLAQHKLALLADVSLRQLQRYETCRQLPRVVRDLVRLSLALKVPFEKLLSPDWLEETTADVEARRLQLGLNQSEIDQYGE